LLRALEANRLSTERHRTWARFVLHMPGDRSVNSQTGSTQRQLCSEQSHKGRLAQQSSCKKTALPRTPASAAPAPMAAEHAQVRSAPGGGVMPHLKTQNSRRIGRRGGRREASNPGAAHKMHGQSDEASGNGIKPAEMASSVVVTLATAETRHTPRSGFAFPATEPMQCELGGSVCRPSLHSPGSG